MGFGMNFARRRLSLSTKSKYAWNVYRAAYGIDNSTKTTGSFTINVNNTKASSITYNASSTGFALTSARNSNPKYLTGKFIVDISGNSSNATSGEYIYHVDSVSISGTTATVNYTRYSSELNTRGEYIEKTYADTAIYPVSGYYNGYYYVMTRGYGELCYWNVYSASSRTPYITQITGGETVSISSSSNVYYSDAYVLDELQGLYLSNVIQQVTVDNRLPSSVYWTKDETGFTNTIYFGVSSSTWSFPGQSGTITSANVIKTQNDYANLFYAKGSFIEQIETSDANKYAEDMISSNRWYTLARKETKWFDFEESESQPIQPIESYYYDSLAAAVTDANTRFASGSNTSQALAKVRGDYNAITGIKLTVLSDFTDNSRMITPAVDMVIDFDGHTISTNSDFFINYNSSLPIKVKFDGTKPGSGISCTNTDVVGVTIVQWVYGKMDNLAEVEFIGGTYNINSQGHFTFLCMAYGGASVKLNGTTVNISVTDNVDPSEQGGGTLAAVIAQNNTRVEIDNCHFESEYDGDLDMQVLDLYNVNSKFIVKNTYGIVDSPYLKNFENRTCFNTMAMRTDADSITYLKDCEFIGIHSGVNTRGEIWVDGGTYQSRAHGGFYFSSNGVARVQNATIQEGNYNGSAPSTAYFNHAAFYIGGGENDHPTVYLDNCTLSSTAYSQFIAFRQCTACKLYMSNTDFPSNTRKFIRIDQVGTNDDLTKHNKVYLGVNCQNVGEDNIFLHVNNHTEDGINYNDIIVAHEGIYNPTATEVVIIDAQKINEHLVSTNESYHYVWNPNF